VFSRLKKHYERSCEKLSEVIDECIRQLSKVADDDPLIGDLEKSIPGFKFPDTLLEHKEKLLNPECKILVTGEDKNIVMSLQFYCITIFYYTCS
jgi:hypothetical protein